MASAITKGIHTQIGQEVDDERVGMFKAGPKFIPVLPAGWDKDEWYNASSPYYLYDTNTGSAYQITGNTELWLTLASAPAAGTISTCVILNGNVVPNFAAKLRLEKYDETSRGVKMSQISNVVYAAGLGLTVGCHIKDKEASVSAPGVHCTFTFTFKSATAGGGTTLSTVTETFLNMGCDIEWNDDQTAPVAVEKEWSAPCLFADVPVGTNSVIIEAFFYQVYSAVKEKVFVDAFFATTKSANAYLDSWLNIDREIMGFTGFHSGERETYFTGITRGELGTLRQKHSKGAKGNILKVIGGSTSDAGHPLNVLLRLLMTRNTGSNTYDVANHHYDKGDGYGLGLAAYGNDLTNTVVDVASIEALRAKTPNYLCEFRLLQGIKNFKEWAEVEIMRPFGYRWSPGKDGMISASRLDTLFLDQERAGTFSTGGVFTPTVAPEWWYVGAGNAQWIKSPNVYLWVKETNLTYPITASNATTVTATGAPTSGAYTCAIVASAAVQPSATAVGYPYVAAFNERDLDSEPEIGYLYDIYNRLTWAFDYDPSNTVDNRQSSKHLSLVDYDESSFWGQTYHDGATSSVSKYGDKYMDFKSAGLRGVGASRFANGYNLNGNRVARQVSYDLIRRWREQVPQIKFNTNNLAYMYVDVGDYIRITYPKCRDPRLGTIILDKVCQVSNVRHDYNQKKITIEAQSLSDITSPPLVAPLTFPTIQDYYISTKHPPLEVIKNLKIRDYPFFVNNLYFVRQTYGATSADDARTRKWKVNQTTGLWVPDFSGYRHTNVYVCETVGGTYRKVAETNEPFIFFAWESDDKGKTAPSLYVKFSYSSNSYDPVTGEYQESSLYPSSPSDVVKLEPYKKGRMGINMKIRHDNFFQVRMAERQNNMRLYSKLHGTVE
jgi:hypothetical protein